MKIFMTLLVAALFVACSNTEDRIAAEKDWEWADSLDAGQMAEPEPPHSVKNIGRDTFMAYRIEYKKEFKIQH